MATKTPEEMAEEWCENHRCHLQMSCHVRGFLAGYQAAKPQWISVKDRLPESREMVWTYGADKKTNYGYMIRKGYWEALREGMEWTEITHWMPLPEAPKE